MSKKLGKGSAETGQQEEGRDDHGASHQKKEQSRGGEEAAVELTKLEEHDVEEHTAQRSPVIFEIIRRTGEEELSRPAISLLFSGITAGLSLGFSVLCQALLRSALPSTSASALIEKLGYSVGFIIVILAHQQLFTENTLTAVVPWMAKPTWKKLFLVGRLWMIVLVANVVGTCLFSGFASKSGVLSVDVAEAFARSLLNRRSGVFKNSWFAELGRAF